jgi:predicted DNA-binding transcriptional regulator YafY
MSNEERRMNRTERLFATILLLQNRPNMTSRDLAEHFGVTRRTIFRDLRALSESGVPLTYAEGGGYEILEGYQLPPLMLTAREAATLLVGTEFMKLQSDASLRKDADQVSLKIRSVLPKEVREYIDRLKQSTVLDPYWLYAVEEHEAEEEGRWYKLSEAIARERSVIMEYFVESRGEVTKRQVDPLGLVYYSDHWNLIAFDHLRGNVRNFRLDRIESMHVLTVRFIRPPGFDLAAHLETRGTGQRHRIILSFTNDVYPRARRAIPAKLEEEGETSEGTQVTFYFENLDYIANWLLRYGTNVRVVEPEDLKRAYHTLVVSLARLYEALPVTT